MRELITLFIRIIVSFEYAVDRFAQEVSDLIKLLLGDTCPSVRNLELNYVIKPGVGRNFH